jgi:universal stress protein A
VKIEKILVPIDFSAHSLRALETAGQFSRAFDAELHLLHVIPQVVMLAAPYAPTLPPDYSAQTERLALDHFRDWKAQKAPADLESVDHVRSGDPSGQILELAADLGVDLIVIGTRGLTGLRHLVLGSVAERTVRGAGCPVLSLKDGSQD